MGNLAVEVLYIYMSKNCNNWLAHMTSFPLAFVKILITDAD